MALGRRARARLGAAVRALLNAPGLEGATDAVRLAVLVLAARTPSVSGRVEIRTGELGRWLGMSASYVASEVLPGLRRSAVVEVTTAKGEFGMDRGLICRVLPLWEARGTAGHPLALHRKEYATWLRLLEALMAPGWLHRDGSVTPTGLLAERTGRGAATDRLALLLLVLEATEAGRVRQCGGRVDTKRGRAAATMARLLGCTASAGERVLKRLEDRGLVRRIRLRTPSGLAHRTRLMIPAVGAAHRAGTAAWGAAVSDPEVAAGGKDALKSRAGAQLSGIAEVGRAGTPAPDVAATLHSLHPRLVAQTNRPDVDRGFSGEGRGRHRHPPKRAYARQNRAVGSQTAAELARPVRPVRGENPRTPTDRQDHHLRIALAPVADLWPQLSGRQRNLVQGAAQHALVALTGLVGPDSAPRILANRLTDRLRETGGAARIRDAVGWMLGRGLVQRPACPDVRCDDGIRIDTGGDCPTCGNVIHMRRAQRARILAEIDTQTPGLIPEERRATLEERMRHQTALDAEAFIRAQVQAERERVAAQVQHCADCGGATQPSGLCEACGLRRKARALVEEATLMATAARPTDADGSKDAETMQAHVRETMARAMADARAHFLQLLGDEAQDSPDQLASALAYNDLRVAEQAVANYRRDALGDLARSPEAEAPQAHAAQLRRNRWHPEGEIARTAAEKAAEDARARTARQLLEQRLERLRAARHCPTETTSFPRTGAFVPRRRWVNRLAVLAARPISDDIPDATA
ncbi:hypothetical protein ACFVYD_11000 [Streptomyces sp. NPDC058301]|uniref:hypothetical protein n=1 Tax=Streptomyces sp. NPDC058301 TaxID=3346436 RepID=UPI0036EBC2FD